MDFRELTYVTAVAECGSLTEAAKKLYIAQPSLSAAIARIEEVEGVLLFDRSSKPLKLTYAGEVYVRRARQILDLRRDLRRELADIEAGAAGKIVFGIPTERAGAMLPELMRAFLIEYPRVEFELYNDSSDELIDLLVREKLDFAVLPKNADELPEGFCVERLCAEPILIAAAKGYVSPTDMQPAPAADDLPFVLSGLLRPERLAAYPLLAMKNGHSIRRKTDTLFRRMGLRGNLFMEFTSCISAAQFASAGLGVAPVPLRAIKVLGAERFSLYQTGTELDEWNINLVWRRGAFLCSVEKLFIEALRQKFNC